MFVPILVGCLVSFLFYNFYWRRRGLPPGPIPLPIIGNIPTLVKNYPGYSIFKKWQKIYGDVYTIWVGNLPIVMINDYDMLVEMNQKYGDEVSGRLVADEFLKIVRGGNYGVLHSDGKVWQEHRRFALRVLRNFGMSKNIMQERILLEVTDMIKKIKVDISNGSTEHYLWDSIQSGVGSIINFLIFGFRVEEDTYGFYSKLKKHLDNVVQILGNPINLAMWKDTKLFQYLPVFRQRFSTLQASMIEIFKIFDHQVKEHRENLNSNAAPNDYIDAYLIENEKRKLDGEDYLFNDNQLNNMCLDLWMAGQETTSTTLSWGIAHIMLHPEVQDKLQNELDRVIGSDRVITLDDKLNLPYTLAVINEAQRITNLLPINVPRRILSDIKLNGLHLKKDTIIVPQIAMVMYDEKIFPEPLKFDPERFITPDMQLKKVDELIPFSVGKRQCLGESLARMELFLFFANFFNQFRFSCVPKKPPHIITNMEHTIRFNPEPYACCMKLRHKK